MYNGASSIDSIARMKQQYDAIFQQNSSYRQSLLVSPYCSKFQKQSPRQSIRNNMNVHYTIIDNSLLDYIKPFEGQHLNKTQSKQKMRKRKPIQNQNRKRTQPNFEQIHYGDNNSQIYIHELKYIIKAKDQRILMLQKSLSELNFKLISQTKATNQSHQKTAYELDASLTNKFHKHTKNTHCKLADNQKQNIQYMQAQILNYKKQIKFLTCNNQQLYEQLQKLQDYCIKLKKTLTTTIMYNQDLQQKIRQIDDCNNKLQQLNNTLINQKQEMMGNYQIQMELFKKMKQVWAQSKKINIQDSKHMVSFSKQKQKNSHIHIKQKVNIQRSKSTKVNVAGSNFNYLKL